ncbi:unnamed protein product [Citrullus colocynthis]|uniref:Uncharacterized protein n=1 Tax=Citrullus colocynthis TaxID=252529 RepID=A0ABP0YS46_9ROSI
MFSTAKWLKEEHPQYYSCTKKAKTGPSISLNDAKLPSSNFSLITKRSHSTKLTSITNTTTMAIPAQPISNASILLVSDAQLQHKSPSRSTRKPKKPLKLSVLRTLLLRRQDGPFLIHI